MRKNRSADYDFFLFCVWDSISEQSDVEGNSYLLGDYKDQSTSTWPPDICIHLDRGHYYSELPKWSLGKMNTPLR